jgi:hypothetical protein
VRACGWILACLVSVLGNVGHAQSGSGSGLRVCVRTPTELGRRVAGRIEGQVSDLPVSLVRCDSTPLEATLAAQVSRARALARREQVRAVVWVAQGEQQLLVHVAVPDTGRILVRRFDTDGNASSASMEAGAVAVRTALRAIERGGIIGVQMGARASPARGEPAAEPEPAETEPADAQAPEPPEASPWGLRVAVGWQLAMDSESDIGQQALAVQLGLGRPPFELGLSASVSVGADLNDELATLRLARHTLQAHGAWSFGRGPWRGTLGASAGVAWFQRSTVARRPSVRPTPEETTASFMFGPRVGVAWMPGSVGLSLQVGLDVIPRPPEFVYRRGETERSVHGLWSVQPRAMLAVQFRSD